MDTKRLTKRQSLKAEGKPNPRVNTLAKYPSVGWVLENTEWALPKQRMPRRVDARLQ